MSGRNKSKDAGSKGKSKSKSKSKSKGRGRGRPPKNSQQDDSTDDESTRIIVDPPDYSEDEDDLPKGKVRTYALVSVYIDGKFCVKFPWQKQWGSKKLYITHGIKVTELLAVISTELSVDYDKLVDGLYAVK